jgi:hypothetical protein
LLSLHLCLQRLAERDVQARASWNAHPELFGPVPGEHTAAFGECMDHLDFDIALQILRQAHGGSVPSGSA